MAIRPATMVLFPMLAAAAAAREWKRFRSDARNLALWSVAIACLFTVCAVPLASWIVPQIFGDSYDRTVDVARVLFLSAPALFLGHVATLVSYSIKLEKKAIVLLTGSVAANVLLNAWAIPSYGAIGAAWTTLATESAATVGMLVMIAMTLRSKLSEAG
jgi:O-antigen/teichoic acid export membrane protein